MNPTTWDDSTNLSNYASSLKDMRKRSLPVSPLASQTRLLAVDFLPGPFDVICGRGKASQNHTGNRRYQVIIDMNVQKYDETRCKIEKSVIVSTIIESIREASPQGGFVRQEGGRWVEVGDHAAREKVGQSLRNLLHTRYRSSVKAKKRRRAEAEAFMRSRSEMTFSENSARDEIKSKDEEFHNDCTSDTSSDYCSSEFGSRE